MQNIEVLTPSSLSDVRPAGAGLSLSLRQTAILAAWGILLWFLAAMFIRCAPEGYFEGGLLNATLFVAAVPLSWLTIRATRRVAALGRHQLVAGTAVASAAAMLCDGIALTWIPQIYGGVSDRLLPAAAWLLWGVAVIFIAAMLAARRREP
jgi:hypothetical protein